MGTVSDPHGARIFNALVTITNVETGQERKTTTNDQGTYTGPFLPPGSYRVRIAAPGFQSLVFAATVAITETTTVDAELPLAGVDTVMVTIDSLVQSDGAQLGRARRR